MKQRSSGADAVRPDAPAPDAPLLERYVAQQDQAAFAEIVRRHGPMVLAACRRILQHAQDAEDAFQATFLVFVRKAAQLDRGQPLAGWLYTVAYQTSLNARSSAAARRHRESQAMSRSPSQPADEPGQRELRSLLDAELNRLPEEYRTPIVLCYLDGQTNEAAARQLGWPVGTLKVRLSRARDMLRNRLSKRGVVLAAALFAEQLAEQAQAAPLAPELVEGLLANAANYAAGAALTGPGADAATLAEGVLQAMPAKPAAVRSPGQRPAKGAPQPAATGVTSWLPLGKLAWLGGISAVFFLGVLAIVLVTGNSAQPGDAAMEASLDNLRTAQRTWWETEGLPRGACADPAEALARLHEKQRGWWANEGLAKAGAADDASALARLEETQRAWLQREQLRPSQAPGDPAGAIARLEALNRRWWQDEGITRLTPAEGDAYAEGDADDEQATRLADAAALKELEVKLLDKAGTHRFLDAGGTRESEEAVQLGLQWLAAQQEADGRWLFKGANVGSSNWQGRRSDVTSTALALLPFLARGETHKGSEQNNIYTKQVERGIQYLVRQQKADGSLMGTPTGGYTHALATIALCEALGMTADPLLKGPCQKAIDFIIRAQDKRGGGWRYSPGTVGDLSVTSWTLMALKSGQMAGVSIPRATLENATKFLKSLEKPDGGYYYQGKEQGHTMPYPATMTAIGIVCRQYLQGQSAGVAGEDVRSPSMLRGLDIVLKNPPTIFEGQKGIRFPVVKRERYTNYYYWYYATYATLTAGGDAWQEWNPRVRDMLVGLQNKGDGDAALKGSWDPEGSQLLEVSGRTGVTALALLTLEVYYRHLPLNRPELGEMAKDLSTRPGAPK